MDQNVFEDISISRRLLKKDDFTFVDGKGNQSQDGIIMLCLILSKLDPSTVVGVELLRQCMQFSS